MRKRYYIWRTFVLTLFLLSVPAEAHGQETSEYEVKAVCLYNFAKFIEWPEGTFPSTETPFNICIVGDNPFGDHLNALNQRRVQDRNLKVSLLEKLTDVVATNCQLVYTNSPVALQTVQTDTRYSKIVTVSEREDGAVIGFRLEDNHVRLIIDLELAKKRGIKISSQLLKLATVRGAKD